MDRINGLREVDRTAAGAHFGQQRLIDQPFSGKTLSQLLDP
jgi:hypothetical protein